MKVIELVKKTGRITVKLKDDREIVLILSNITMGDLKSAICNFKIQDKMENCGKQSTHLAVPRKENS